jgi:hypothetical protein
MNFSELINYLKSIEQEIITFMSPYDLPNNREKIDDIVKVTMPVIANRDYNIDNFNQLELDDKEIFIFYLIFLELYIDIGNCRFFLQNSIQNKKFDNQILFRCVTYRKIEKINLREYEENIEGHSRGIVELIQSSFLEESIISNQISKLLGALILTKYINEIKISALISQQPRIPIETITCIAEMSTDYEFIEENVEGILMAYAEEGGYTNSRKILTDKIRTIHQQNQLFLVPQ